MKHTFIILIIAFAIPSSAQWRYINHGTLDGEEAGLDQAFGVHDSTLFVGFGGHGVWRYTSGSWHGVNNGLDLTQGNITSFASLGPYVFASPGLRAQEYTTDNGSQWNNGNAAGPVASNGIYLFGEYPYMTNIARSRDMGKTWDSVAHLVASGFAADGACIFAATASGIFRSADSGTNWAKTTTPVGLSISAFAVIDTQIFAGGMGVFRSVDSGQNWTQISLPNITVNALAASRGYLFAGADTGVFVSSDSGKSWKNVSQGMSVPPGNRIDVTLLAVLDTTLFAEVYAGTDVSGNVDGYATARPISEMIDSTKSAVQESLQPSATTLSVFPNPLANTAIISYTLAEDSRVNITIIDALGRTVSIPVSGLNKGAGEHEITFDSQNIPSGVYWCHLSAGDIERAVKLVVEK